MSVLNKYSPIGLIYVLYCYIRTKFFFPSSRIIKFPFDVRGRKYIDFGRNLTLGKNCRFEVYSDLMEQNENKKLVFGNNVTINDYVHITALGSVTVGNNVLMASHIYISDCQHGKYEGKNSSNPDIPPMMREYQIEHVSIGDNVWIGEHVSILPGVSIGNGTVVGANSVVTRSVPPYCVVVGSPAKIVKKFDFEKQEWVRL